MGKEDIDRECMEFECNELSRRYMAEASRTAVQAFNEGYLLGRRHAKAVFNQEASDED